MIAWFRADRCTVAGLRTIKTTEYPTPVERRLAAGLYVRGANDWPDWQPVRPADVAGNSCAYNSVLSLAECVSLVNLQSNNKVEHSLYFRAPEGVYTGNCSKLKCSCNPPLVICSDFQYVAGMAQWGMASYLQFTRELWHAMQYTAQDMSEIPLPSAVYKASRTSKKKYRIASRVAPRVNLATRQDKSKSKGAGKTASKTHQHVHAFESAALALRKGRTLKVIKCTTDSLIAI